MSKKEARDELDIDNLLHPIDMLKIGTDDDPCFGTYDASANECKICGDSSICQIAQLQNISKKRALVESKQNFKDLEMEVKNTYLEPKDVKKVIVKATKKKDISKGNIIRLIKKKLDPKNRVEIEHIQKVIISVVRSTDSLKFIKVKNKRYIKWTN